MDPDKLAAKAIAYFKMAHETTRGRRALDLISWHQIISFIVDDKPIFYLDVQRGSVEVCKGEAPEQDPDPGASGDALTGAEIGPGVRRPRAPIGPRG